jgi:glycosyltransferase involved in cell wall biosynthesis
VVVVPNVIDLETFDAVRTDLDLKAGHRGPLVMAVGRLVRAKRFDRFVAALAGARRRVPELRGVIVGDGPERDALEAEARRLDLNPPALRFVGRRVDVPALLRQADILVSSSDHEGFPNVLLEAMAAYLPVVTTPAGDAASVVASDVTGYVVPADDLERLADRVAMLAESPAIRRAAGHAGRTRVELMYRDDNLADRLLTVYRDAADRHPRGHAEGRGTAWSSTETPRVGKASR